MNHLVNQFHVFLDLELSEVLAVIWYTIHRVKSGPSVSAFSDKGHGIDLGHCQTSAQFVTHCMVYGHTLCLAHVSMGYFKMQDKDKVVMRYCGCTL